MYAIKFLMWVVTIFIFALVYPTKDLQSNDLQFVAIMITLWIFTLTDINSSLKYWHKQEDVLRFLYSDVVNLLKKGGHIDLFKRAYELKGTSDHEMYRPNLDYYLINIGHNVNYNQTTGLKELLKLINDKISMLNNYRANLNLWQDKCAKEKGKYMLNLFKELRGYLLDMKKIISDDHRIRVK